MRFPKGLRRVGGFLVAVLLVGLQAAPHAQAKPAFFSAFIAKYPASTNLFTCGTCHYDFNGPQNDLSVGAPPLAETGEGLNPFGRAFAEAGGEENPAAALDAIAGSDADHDGTNNGDEILTLPGFMPGYDCDSYMRAVNAPANLAFFVDPTFVGCGVTTTTLSPTTTTAPSVTTTTMPSVSTTMSETTTTMVAASTTTTLPGGDRCAQPLTSGPQPTASDCLVILKAALGAGGCDPECICAPKGSLPISATDALICLKRAIGQQVTLQCPCEGVTTTTTSSTTTTMAGGSVQVGQGIYDTRCSACHSAGAHDTGGFAGNLAGKGSLLVNNLATINSAMNGITLTDREIADLAAFLDSL
jgi:Cytochrome C oxidase, cbb3-type, subunit III